MSREEKIAKLCRAIKAYRGASVGKDKEGKTLWHITPKPADRPKVVALLQKLSIDPEEMVLIDDFKTIDEFNQWVETIR